MNTHLIEKGSRRLSRYAPGMPLVTCHVCGRERLLAVDGKPRPHVDWRHVTAPYQWCIGDGASPPTFTSPPTLSELARLRSEERGVVE